jgi:signal transduction histidine kinase
MTSVSHELRTPLNGILGFAGLLMRERAGPLTAEQRRQLGFILASGEQLRALITDVLDLTQIESGRMTLRHEAFDLAELVAEVVDQLRPQAERKGLTIHQHGLASLPLQGDRRKTMQVLLSVAGNAVKFTERGSVRLAVSAATEDAARHDGSAGPAWVAVHDTGVGISAEQLPQLFQAFRQLQGGLTRPYGGTGLGLHLTRRLLDQMGGDIVAESRPGEGSVFRIRLPRVGPRSGA